MAMRRREFQYVETEGGKYGIEPRAVKSGEVEVELVKLTRRP